MSTKQKNKNITADEHYQRGVRNPDLYPEDAERVAFREGVIRDNYILNASTNPVSPDKPPKKEQLQEDREKTFASSIALAQQRVGNPAKGWEGVTINSYGFLEPEYSGLDIGTSKYDPSLVTGPLYQEDLQNIRAYAQPEILKLVNGVTKGVITAGTTFLSNLVATPTILLTGLYNMADGDSASTFLSGMWDNPILNAAQSVQEWAEKAIPNYYDSEGKGTWGNFIGDKFLKNMGFIVGTAAAAYVGGGVSLAGITGKGLAKLTQGITNNALAATKTGQLTKGIIDSFHGALVEGGIEAVQNSKEWFNTMKYNLDTDLQYGNITQEEYSKRLNQLKLDQVKMGNADFVANAVLLGLSNSLQFGRAFGTGFESVSRFLGVERTKEGLLQATKELPKRIAKGVGKGLMEGTEEASQKALSTISGLAAEEDYMAYLNDKNNYKNQRFVNSVINNISQGLKETFHDPSTKEEFLIGALLGFTGVPFVKKVNVNGKTVTRPTMMGGIFEEISNYRQDLQATQEMAQRINEREKEDEVRFKNLMVHAAATNEQDAFASERRKFDFKNSEFKELFADVDMYASLGILEDYKNRLRSFEIDDTTLNEIIQASNATVETSDGPKLESIGFDDNGNPLDRNEIRAKIEKTKASVLDTIDKYQKERSKILIDSQGVFNDEQLSQLTWMSMMQYNWNSRAAEMLTENNTELSNAINDSVDQVFAEESIEKTADYTEIQNARKTPIGLLKEIAKRPGLYTKVRDSLDESLVQSFDDCVRCAKGITNFENRKNTYMRNPYLLAEDMDTALKDMRNAWYDDEINGIFTSLVSGVMTKDQLFDALDAIDTAQQYKDEFSKRLEARVAELPDGDLKNLVSEYQRVNKEAEDFRKAVEATNENRKKTEKHTKKWYADIDELSNELAGYVRRQLFVSGKTLDEVIDDFAKSENFSKSEISKIKTIIKAAKETATTAKESPIPPANSINSMIDVANIQEFVKNPEEIGPVESIPLDAEKISDGIKTVLNEIGIDNEAIQQIADIKKDVAEEYIQHEDKHLPSVEESSNPSQYNPEDSTDNSQDEEQSENKPSDENALVLTNWNGKDNTKYNIEGLNSRHQKDENTNPFVQKMNELGAYDFIDNGKLGKLAEKNAREGKPTKIHWVFNLKDSALRTEDGKYERVLLAVETEEGNVVIGEKKYQIVGELGGKMSYEYGKWIQNDTYKKARSKARAALNDAKAKDMIAEDQEWYLCNNSNTYLRKIYGGRFVKTDSLQTVTRSVGDVLANGKPLRQSVNPASVIGMQVVMNDETVNSKSGVQIQPLNAINAATLNGSIWMLTKQADGRWYPRYCNVKTASKWREGLGSNPETNPLYKTIQKLCNRICGTNLADAVKAKYELMNYIYMGPAIRTPNGGVTFSNEVHINSKNGKTILSSKAFGSIELTGDVATDSANLMDKLFDKDSGLRMQFNFKDFKNDKESYVNNAIKYDILETDIMQVENVNASFDMSVSSEKEALEEYNKQYENIPSNPEKQFDRDSIYINNTRFVRENGEWNTEGMFSQEFMDNIARVVDSQPDAVDDKNNSVWHFEESGVTYYVRQQNNANTTLISKDIYDEIVDKANSPTKVVQTAEDIIAFFSPETRQKPSEETPVQEQKTEEKKPVEKKTEKPVKFAEEDVVKTAYNNMKAIESSGETSVEEKQKAFDNLKNTDKQFPLWDVLASTPLKSIRGVLGKGKTKLDARNLIVQKIQEGKIDMNNLATVEKTNTAEFLEILEKCK